MKIRLEANVAAGNPLKNRLGGARRKVGNASKKNMIKVNLNMLTEHFYICSQLMKYQNMRGGRVKLHHIMVRNLLFFSAKKKRKVLMLKLSNKSPL